MTTQAQYDELLAKIRATDAKLETLARLWKCAPRDVVPMIQKYTARLDKSREILEGKE